MVIVAKDGRIILVNSRTERPFGFALHKILNERIEALIPERFRGGHLGRRMACRRKLRVSATQTSRR